MSNTINIPVPIDLVTAELSKRLTQTVTETIRSELQPGRSLGKAVNDECQRIGFELIRDPAFKKALAEALLSGLLEGIRQKGKSVASSLSFKGPLQEALFAIVEKDGPK